MDQNGILKAQELIKRTLDNWEKEIFLFSRKCRKCGIADTKDLPLKNCQGCANVAFCSLHTTGERKKSHSELMCQELKFAMGADNYEMAISVATPNIPSNFDTKFIKKILSQNIWEYLMKHGGNKKLDFATELEFRFLTDRLSCPLTILYSSLLAKKATSVKVEEMETITLHIVGANVVEMLGLIKFEYLIHRLPKCTHLKIVFVGMELDNEENGPVEGVGECYDCSDKGNVVNYELYSMSYKEYCENTSEYTMPNYVVAFNCNLHLNDVNDEDTWNESLPFLVRHSNIPLILTNHTLTHSKESLKRMTDLNLDLDLIKTNEKNPFRSHRPIRDYELNQDMDVFYNNQYLSILIKK